MGSRERSAAIYHNYYCRSVTGLEIIGAVMDPRGKTGGAGKAGPLRRWPSESTGTGSLTKCCFPPVCILFFMTRC